MNTQSYKKSNRGFTLMETVIAIGVIALLITGFVAVFVPAVDGIRRSISAEEANRLTSTLERELVTLRGNTQRDEYATGFEKAINWIEQSNDHTNALIIYQYRGQINSSRVGTPPNDDNTSSPSVDSTDVAGTNFITVPMLRQNGDPLLTEDLAALEGRAYVVRCTPLVRNAEGGLRLGTFDELSAENEAVITFTAEFFSLPSRDLASLTEDRFNNLSRPMFTRNLAVRR